MPKKKPQDEDDIFINDDFVEENLFEETSDGASWNQSRLKSIGLAVACIFVAFLFFGVVHLLTDQSNTNPAAPRVVEAGKDEFERASGQILSNKGSVGLGNSSLAVTMANDFSIRMGTLREVLFTKRSRPSLVSLSKGQFLVYCHMQDDRCVFLVHVPDLRKFDADAKEELGNLAWRVAQQMVENPELKQKPSQIAVGLRGIMFYDRVMIGRTALGKEDAAEAIVTNSTRASCEELLYPFFAPPKPGDNEVPPVSDNPMLNPDQTQGVEAINAKPAADEKPVDQATPSNP